MPTDDSTLKIVLGEIETVRMKRQRERADRPRSTWKRFTQQELNDEACPTYKNLLVGRSRRIPDRQTIIGIADYLECGSDERNDLLMAAGYLPIRTEWEGRELKLGLDWAQRTMRDLPFPAMIVTSTQDIKGYNEPFLRLFEIPLDRAFDTLMNRIDLHCHPDLPIRSRSTFDKESFELWESHIVHGIQAFKREHLLSRYDDWYQRLVRRAQDYGLNEKVDKYEKRQISEEEPDRAQSILARADSAGELVPIRFKQVSMTSSNCAYPRIQVFLPVDAPARQLFEDLGCPADCGPFGSRGLAGVYM